MGGQKYNPFIVDGFKVEGFCCKKKSSYYVQLTEDDIHDLERYASDLGYLLEPIRGEESMENAIRVKVINPENGKYGWISRVKKLVNGEWIDEFLYGCYISADEFRNKYSISENIFLKVGRTKQLLQAKKFPIFSSLFRNTFGILDLEDEPSIGFLLSYLSTHEINIAS